MLHLAGYAYAQESDCFEGLVPDERYNLSKVRRVTVVNLIFKKKLKMNIN